MLFYWKKNTLIVKHKEANKINQLLLGIIHIIYICIYIYEQQALGVLWKAWKLSVICWKAKTVRGKVDQPCACLPGILLTGSEELPSTSLWRVPADYTRFHCPLAVAGVTPRSCAFWAISTARVSVAWELEKGNGARPPSQVPSQILFGSVTWNCHFYRAKIVTGEAFHTVQPKSVILRP